MAGRLLVSVVCTMGLTIGQTTFAQTSDTPKHSKHQKSAKHDIASGVGDVGKGAGKGAGSAAKGTAKAAVDLATLHPVDSATDLGKGAIGAGAHVGVGTVKGTSKIVKGTGKAIKHVF
jgi:hypothetical protein